MKTLEGEIITIIYYWYQKCLKAQKEDGNAPEIPSEQIMSSVRKHLKELV